MGCPCVRRAQAPPARPGTLTPGSRSCRRGAANRRDTARLALRARPDSQATRRVGVSDVRRKPNRGGGGGGGGAVRVQVDEWGVGCAVLEMLAGSSPFQVFEPARVRSARARTRARTRRIAAVQGTRLEPAVAGPSQGEKPTRLAQCTPAGRAPQRSARLVVARDGSARSNHAPRQAWAPMSRDERAVQRRRRSKGREVARAYARRARLSTAARAPPSPTATSTATRCAHRLGWPGERTWTAAE